MPRIDGSIFAILLTAGCLLGSANAQQPGKPRDPTPFSRPSPLCTFDTTDVSATFRKVISILNGENYQTDSVSSSDGEISAKRNDGAASPNQDRVIVWLERDFAQPQTKLKLYLLYGRYEQFFGNTDLTRVKVDSGFEDQHVGQLKQKLIDYANSGGNQ